MEIQSQNRYFTPAASHQSFYTAQSAAEWQIKTKTDCQHSTSSPWDGSLRYFGQIRTFSTDASKRIWPQSLQNDALVDGLGISSEKNQTALPRQPSSGHQRGKWKRGRPKVMVEDSGSRNEITKEELEHFQENGKRPTGMESPHCCPTTCQRHNGR